MHKSLIAAVLTLAACGEVYDTTTGLGACMAYMEAYNACVSQVGNPGGLGTMDGLEESFCEMYDETLEDFDAEAAADAVVAFNCTREMIESIDCSDPLSFPDVFTGMEDCGL